MIEKRSFPRTPAIIFFALFLCSCGGMTPRQIGFDREAPLTRPEKILKALLSENSDILSIKGSGQIKLTQGSQTTSIRVYWMGKRPDRVRIEVRAVTGQALLSFAADGEKIYIYSYDEERLYRKKASRGIMARIVGVEMTPRDFLDLLNGCIPVHQDGDVRVEPLEGGGERLVVDGRGRDFVDAVILGDGGEVIEFQRWDERGELIFRALFHEEIEAEDHQLPGRISIDNGEDAAIEILVHKCWLNPEIDEGKFVLEAP